MIFKSDLPTIKQAEELARAGAQPPAVLAVLRRLSALDFGCLHLSMPHADFPALSGVLPRMASPETQTAWTGSQGYDLFRQTKDFVLRLDLNFERLCGRTLKDAKILDYGCGWGRLARMMMYYTDPDSFWAVDPLEDSIDICRRDGILGNLALSDYIPTTLPVGTEKFDLIYSYSVFTHTSERATLAALGALRHCIRDDGLLIVTVRPVEIWDLPSFGENPNANHAALIEAHQTAGFSFLPNVNMLVDGESTYGVTSITPEWIEARAASWRVVARDRGEDGLQYILALRPQ